MPTSGNGWRGSRLCYRQIAPGHRSDGTPQESRLSGGQAVQPGERERPQDLPVFDQRWVGVNRCSAAGTYFKMQMGFAPAGIPCVSSEAYDFSP